MEKKNIFKKNFLAYEINDRLPIKSEIFGVWNRSDIINLQPLKSKIEKRRNFAGSPIVGSTIILQNDSLNHLTDYRDRHIDTPTKLNYNFALQIAYFLNASFQMSIVDDWGYPNKMTGHWPGMVGELVRNEADLGVTPLFHAVYRLPHIEFISYTSFTKFYFVFRSPKLSITDNVFLLPFTNLVWICALLLVLIMICSYFAVIMVEWNTQHRKLGVRPQFIESVQTIFNAVCQQGNPNSPHGLSARIVLFLAFLVLMLIYTSYAANIVALLQSPSNKIQTLEDLLQSRLTLGAADTPYNRFYFSVSNLCLVNLYEMN